MITALSNEHQLKPLKAVFAFLEKEFPGKEYAGMEIDSVTFDEPATWSVFFYNSNGLSDDIWAEKLRHFEVGLGDVYYARVKLKVHKNEHELIEVEIFRLHQAN